MIGNEQAFVRQFRTRLMDCARQNWHDSIITQADYVHYNPEMIRANYIENLQSYEHRRAICLLRCSRLPLNGTPRFGKMKRDPICKQCSMQCIEDVKHFLLVCPRYISLRNKYIPLYYTRFPCDAKVYWMLCNMNVKRILNLNVAKYVNECLKIRDLSLRNLWL